MVRVVRVSTIQLPVWKEGETPREIKEINLKRIFSMLKTAGERNSDVAVFGEMGNSRNLPFNEETLLEYADAVPGPLTDHLGKIAKRHSMNVIAPIIGLCDGKLRNVALAINRQGKIVGKYFKVHLPEPEVKAGIVPGENFPVIPLDFGNVGVMICMDIEYPEGALILMLKGAEILFFPHVQSGWGEIDWETP